MEEVLSMVFLPLLPLLILIFSLTLLKTTPKINLPPGPRPWPILGNLLQLRKHPHAALANMARSHGPLISLKLGTQLLVVASSPASAAQVLKTHDRVLSARYVPQAYRVKSFIEHSLVLSFDCDDRWKSLRTLCMTKLFMRRMLEEQAHLRERKVDEMIGYVFARRGEVVKMNELVLSTIFNIVGNIFFSRDVFNLDKQMSGVSESKRDILRFLKLRAVSNLADSFPSLAWLDIEGLNRMAKAIMDKAYETWEEFIRERQDDENDNKGDFLDALLSAGYSDIQIKALITELFIAGTNTNTIWVNWTMSELIRNPKLMQKVRDELEQVVGERRNGECAVKESHLSHLTYLEACMKETLRLHPPSPLLLPRQALDTCEVMNYTIPKGCRVIVNAWAIGRDPETWKDPLTFSPERFLDSGVDYKGKNFELVPFGGGRRICPGLPMATCTVKLILASLIHAFDWSLPHGMEPNELNMDESSYTPLDRKQPLLLVPK